MKTETRVLSEAFQRLYCEAAVFEDFSERHAIRFSRVLPFRAADPVMDDARLLAAEAAHLAQPNAATRLAVVEAFGGCGLLPAAEVAGLRPVMDFFGADFFELMGEVYANAGMFRCALRWHREYIAVLESQTPGVRSDREDVYASVGHGLLALGRFAEASAWTKSCVGPDWLEVMIGAALTDYQAQLLGGGLRVTERATNRTRFTAGTAQDAEVTREYGEHLKAALKKFAPFQETYVDWVGAAAPVSARPVAEGYPFKVELDSGCLPRHKMNLLFALCGQAEELAARGFAVEARRLWEEAALLEPEAEFVRARI